MGHNPIGLSDIRRITTPAFVQPDAALGAQRGVSAAERGLLNWVVRALGNPPVDLVLWNGEAIGSTQQPAVARVYIRDPGVLRRLALHADLYFGDDYTAARVEVEGHIVEFFEVIYRAMARAPKPGLLRRALHRWLIRPRRNTLDGSRENIHHHYDLGNDFYKLWLDSEMLYTCAYF